MSPSYPGDKGIPGKRAYQAEGKAWTKQKDVKIKLCSGMVVVQGD